MLCHSWNVNGLRACWNKGTLKKFINETNPDIICLQEVKAQPDQSPLEDMGYNLIWSSSQTKKGYSGTLILSKQKPLSSTIDFDDQIKTKYNFADDYGQTDKEGRLIVVEYPSFFVVNVYTPNSKNDLSRLGHREKVWDPAFREYCAQLQSKKPILVAGDLNVAAEEIDLARPKPNEGKHGFTKEERAGFAKLIDQAKLVDSFRQLHPDEQKYSWWTYFGKARERNIGWRIDYWLVSQSLLPKVKAAEIRNDVFGSDHCPVSLEIDID